MSNIVHFGKFYFPDSGGIESVTVSLARGAVMHGNSVTVVCFKKGGGEPDVVVDGVRVIRESIAKMVASQPLGMRYALACIREGRRADVVHLHAPNMIGALCALFLGRRPRLVVHWHSDVVGKGMLGRVTRPLERAMLRRANCVVATSGMYAEASESLKEHREKLIVVPIGTADVRTNTDALPYELDSWIRGRKIVLAVGRMVPYKGFDILIEAAAYLDDNVAIVLVGGGPLEAQLRAQIERANLSDKVRMTGRLDDEILASLFGRASVFCLPSVSRAEAFGVVLLEAMAYGVPIVSSAIAGSGVSWVNQHDVSGLNVKVGDKMAIADAINEICQSEITHSRLSRGARERFLSEFAENVSVKRFIAIYDRLTSLRE